MTNSVEEKGTGYGIAGWVSPTEEKGQGQKWKRGSHKNRDEIFKSCSG